MQKNLIGIAGGLLTVISNFLGAVSYAGSSFSFFKFNKPVAIFFIICGLIVVGVSMAGKKWLNILSIIIGLIIAGLALKYQGDAKTMAGEDAIGIGLWIMLLGGVISLIGGVMGIVKKPAIQNN